MLQQAAASSKGAPSRRPPLQFDGAAAPGIVEVGGGPVGLGADPEGPDFGWDNEFPRCDTEVQDFLIDRTPVRNGEFLEFVADGGYRRPELWGGSDWSWRDRIGLHCPAFWSRRDGQWFTHTVFEQIPLERAIHWPTFVSLAEARAYCRWRGARLATEAELHRAAHTAPDGSQRPYPWGDEPPGPRHGNFDFRHWAPTPVGAFSDGDSAWGLADVVGNGWEWTASVFAPFPGFEVTVPSYPGYSADFFDDRHFVMIGASWATPSPLIRRSFRNWFHDHYPFVFAKFRCVRDR
jgi:formylglycine-generating enzyme required for sulfatase activity